MIEGKIDYTNKDEVVKEIIKEMKLKILLESNRHWTPSSIELTVIGIHAQLIVEMSQHHAKAYVEMTKGLK